MGWKEADFGGYRPEQITDILQKGIFSLEIISGGINITVNQQGKDTNN